MRYLGHCFNPVSFYFCFDADESMRAVVAEVANTPWGERHAYVMARADGLDEPRALRAQVAKARHVSPLMGMDQRYDWRVQEPGPRLKVKIDAIRAGRTVFTATLELRRRELDTRALRRVLWRYPVATRLALARIYARALRLRLAGAPWFGHPRDEAG